MTPALVRTALLGVAVACLLSTALSLLRIERALTQPSLGCPAERRPLL